MERVGAMLLRAKPVHGIEESYYVRIWLSKGLRNLKRSRVANIHRLFLSIELTNGDSGLIISRKN